MKHLTKYIFICFFLLKAFTGFAQTSMTTIISEGDAKVKALEEEGKSIVNISFDIVYKDSDKAIYETLYASKTYYFYALSSSRILDLDIELYVKKEGEWSKIKSDITSANDAYFSFTPEKTAYYGILIKGKEFNSDYTASHFGLIISDTQKK